MMIPERLTSAAALGTWGTLDLAARAVDEAYPNVRRLVSEAKKIATEAAWGDGQRVVDFGADGLWTYDGRSWTKITR